MGHAASKAKMRTAYKVLVETPERSGRLRSICEDNTKTGLDPSVTGQWQQCVIVNTVVIHLRMT